MALARPLLDSGKRRWPVFGSTVRCSSACARRWRATEPLWDPTQDPTISPDTSRSNRSHRTWAQTETRYPDGTVFVPVFTVVEIATGSDDHLDWIRTETTDH